MRENQLRRSTRKQVDKNFIGVMGKIFAVLEFFVAKNPKQSVTFQEVAQGLPFARTTVHRILFSLEKLGYLEKTEPRAHYRLASKFFELTENAFHFRRLQEASKSVMQGLMMRFAETVNLAVLDEGQVEYIDVLQSPNALRMTGQAGVRASLHSTSLGKAILAYLPDQEVLSLLEGSPLIKMTPKTITQKAYLLEHLASVREQRVAVDLEENLSGVICVAAPIFEHHGRVVAAISISGPASRMEPQLQELRQEVRNAGVTITRMLSPHTFSTEREPSMHNGLARVASPSSGTSLASQ